MPTLAALLHTHNDALRLGRALEMLFPCDETLIVDHNSSDRTRDVAREYGAKILPAGPGVSYLQTTRAEWILILDPRESVTESLAASLFEWKSEEIASSVRAFSIFFREETTEGWIQNPIAQTRLVRADWSQWQGHFPQQDVSSEPLEGELLRFVFP